MQTIPPPVFGHVLQLLTIGDICLADIAISSAILREHWWVGKANYKKRPIILDVCLRHALHPQQLLCVNSDSQVRWLQKRQVISSNLHVDAHRIGSPSFRNLVSIPPSLQLQLTSLCLESLGSITKIENYLSIISGLRHLRVLEFSSVVNGYLRSGASVRDILTNNIELATLVLGGPYTIYFSQYLRESASLRHLHLENPHLMSLVGLLLIRSRLNSISLVDTANIALILGFFAHPFVSMLTYVNLSQSNQNGTDISDECVAAISNCCPLLETLDISVRCTSKEGIVTDDAITYLAVSCRSLFKVSFYQQRKITLVSFEALLANCICIMNLDFTRTGMSSDYMYARCLELKAEGRVVNGVA